MARCLGGLLRNRLEFRPGPSPLSSQVRNCARCRRRQIRGDEGFGFVRLSDDHEIAVARRKVKAHELAAGCLNQLADSRLSILGCGNQPLGIVVSEAPARNQSNNETPPYV